MIGFFDKLEWKKDRMIFENLVFRLEHFKNSDWELGNNCFVFYKIKPLIDQYSKFWSFKPQFNPQNVMELGMWDGGSTAFWFECFHPKKLIGIDLMQREDSDYFQQYIISRGLRDCIKTYWNTDQTDLEKIRNIIEKEFSGPIDLVIDDASHAYEATKISFEMLFPLLRPGGLYIIEDWAWGHWKEYQSPNHPIMGNMTEPTKLIFELVEATGSSKDLIANLSIFEGFTVIERGEIALSKLAGFNLEAFISRRPPMNISSNSARRKLSLSSDGRRWSDLCMEGGRILVKEGPKQLIRKYKEYKKRN